VKQFGEEEVVKGLGQLFLLEVSEEVSDGDLEALLNNDEQGR